MERTENEIDRSIQRQCAVPYWVRPEPRRPRENYRPIFADDLQLAFYRETTDALVDVGDAPVDDELRAGHIR